MRSVLFTLFAVFLGAALGGCSIVAPLTGNASYSYEEYDAGTGKKTCKLTVHSGRESTGVNAKACGDGLSVTANEVNQGNSTADVAAMLNAVLGLVKVGAASPAPATSTAPVVTPLPDYLNGTASQPDK